MWLGQVCFRPQVTVSPLPWQVAVANLSEAVQDADLLVFVIPHQFIHRICDEITGRVPKDALGITLIKVRRPLAARGLLGTSAPLSSAGEKELRGGDKNTGAGVPFPSPEDLPDARIEPMSPALAGIFFTTEPLGKPRQ